MKKIMTFLIAIMIGFSMIPHLSEARGFSHSFSRPHITTPSRTNTYHSGYTSPSNKVTRTPNSTVNRRSSTFGRGLATHAAAFGAGMLLGHMFHPFGGYYGGGTLGFSFLGILLDIVILLVIIWLIKKIVTRRRD